MTNFIALTSAGIEPLLEAELIELGASNVRAKVQSVSFEASFEVAQKICLWSRLSTRILKHLNQVSVKSKEDIYHGVMGIDWSMYFSGKQTFATEFVGTDKSIRNTQFGALTIKDAIVDNLREESGRRPDVDKSSPDIRVQGRLFKGKCDIYVDFSGSSMHQRGYREQQGAAPLKEHLAAALVKRSGWDKTTPLVDLFAGSATILIEAAMMHMNIAPGLNKKHQFLFRHHPEFNKNKYAELIADTENQQTECSVDFIGFEIAHQVLEKAQNNINRAGLKQHIKLVQQDAANASVNKDIKKGWIVSNPPYGERIGDSVELLTLFKKLGFQLKQHFQGWNLSLFTSQALLLKLLRLQKERDYKIKNGPLETVLTNYKLTEQQCQLSEQQIENYYLSKDGQAFAGRIEKNRKRLTKWAKKEKVNCYRLYDADIPEYNVAVDYYDGRIVVYEYQAPKSVNANLAELRLLDVLSILQEKFSLNGDSFSLKVRKSQKGKQQYQKQDTQHHRFTVEEYGAKFYINIHDYLDTGLFLDHRQVRAEFAKLCSGKSVLNLFCYTGSVSVHAALNGAKRVTSVDMSNTYLDWAEDNFRVNHIDKKKHFFQRADCLDWLSKSRDKFDVVFLDPPSFSNSKKMNRTWDVQRDHVEILTLLKERLNEGGQVLFSNNLRNFKLDEEQVSELGFSIKDIKKSTLPEDFKRNANIHHCWLLSL